MQHRGTFMLFPLFVCVQYPPSYNHQFKMQKHVLHTSTHTYTRTHTHTLSWPTLMFWTLFISTPFNQSFSRSASSLLRLLESMENKSKLNTKLRSWFLKGETDGRDHDLPKERQTRPWSPLGETDGRSHDLPKERKALSSKREMAIFHRREEGEAMIFQRRDSRKKLWSPKKETWESGHDLQKGEVEGRGRWERPCSCKGEPGVGPRSPRGSQVQENHDLPTDSQKPLSPKGQPSTRDHDHQGKAKWARPTQTMLGHTHQSVHP